MFIQVKLLNGFKEPLWYKAPAHNERKDYIGSIVHVPLRARIVPACIIAQTDTIPTGITFAIRSAQSLEPLPADMTYWMYLHQLADFYCTDALFFIKRIKQF